MPRQTPKDKYVSVWVGPGRFSFPSLVTPDTGREFSDNKFKTDLVIQKAVFKEKNRAIIDAVLKVGKEQFGEKFKLAANSKFRNPFKDSDTDEKITIDSMKDSIIVRAKSKNRPVFISGRKGADGRFAELNEEQIKNIKGGDWGKILVSVFAYTQAPGGVSFGLQAVQFGGVGEAFGQGKTRILESAEEMETELDDVDDDDVIPGVAAEDDDEEEDDDGDLFA